MAVGIAALRRAIGTRIVVMTRIGRIGCLNRAQGGVVVGECHVDRAGDRVYCSPFRTVHPGCAQGVGREARVDQNIRLVGKRILATGKAGCAIFEFHPFTAAVSIEFRDIKAPAVEVLVAGSQTARGVGGIPIFGGDVLVDVLIA